jgi:hypothetical protein
VVIQLQPELLGIVPVQALQLLDGSCMSLHHLVVLVISTVLQILQAGVQGLHPCGSRIARVTQTGMAHIRSCLAIHTV